MDSSQTLQQQKLDREIEVLRTFVEDPEEARRLVEEEGASAPTEQQRQWKEAYRKSITWSSVYLFAFFVAQTGLTTFLALTRHNLGEQELKELLPLWFLLWIAIFAIRWLLDAVSTIAFRATAMPGDAVARKSWLLRRCKYRLHAGLYINLFSLRHIWLWTLFAGCAGASLTFLTTGSNNATVFTQDLLRALIIALVAYIATNVVREMLDMRVRYLRSVQRLEDIDQLLDTRQKSITEQVQSFNSTADHFSSQADIIIATTSIFGVEALLNKMLRTTNAIDSDLIRKAFENIGKEARFISDRLTAIDGPHAEQIRRLYLNVLNPYVEAELREFAMLGGGKLRALSREQGIVTRFSVAGKMVEGLLTAKDLNVTFHALLVIPPARFLNYRAPEGFADEWKSLTGGDRNWESYLAANMAVAQTGLVERQFLSIGGDTDMLKDSPEAKMLRSTYVKKQLELWVLCKNRSPLRVKCKDKKPIKDGEDYIEAGSDSNGDEWKYVLQEKPEGNGPWIRLDEVIGTMYHGPKKCYVREIDAEHFVRPGGEIGKLLKDPETKKPLDYFAARDISGKWVFCLRMRYDRDFDVAILDFLYPGDISRVAWEETERHLKMLFDSSDECTPITEYAKQTAKG
ncbi:MAG: hypothetical protein WAO00_12445 [Chthoniobacterales bacterium]